MDNVEEQILTYPHLSAEKQRAIEEYVETHPEWAPLLRDVRTIESLLSDLSLGESDLSGPPLLTAYVVDQHIGLEAASETLNESFARLDRRLEEDAELQARVDAILDRLKAAEDELDPVSHFESLTGHSLSPDPERTSETESVSAQREAPAGDGAMSSLTRLIDQFLALPLAVRGVGAALVMLFGAYLSLFVASKATQSTPERLAAVEVSDQMVESYYSTNTRSVAPSSDTVRADALYLRALSTLREARSSTLGLFPSYNPDSLEHAEKRLRRVLDRTDPNSFLALETQFYLGKVYLAQGRIEAARTRFKTVVEQDGRRTQEARQILRALEGETGGQE